MITQPESNIKLDSDQEARLTYVKNKLENLQAEVLVATRVLSEKRAECALVVKEKDYQQGLLEGLVQMVQVNTKQNEKLKIDIENSTKILEDNTQKCRLVTEETNKKTEAIKQREDALIVVERNYEEKMKDLKVKEAKVEEDRLLVEKAQMTLTEALKTIRWK